jgi:hypothetical protein
MNIACSLFLLRVSRKLSSKNEHISGKPGVLFAHAGHAT